MFYEIEESEYVKGHYRVKYANNSLFFAASVKFFKSLDKAQAWINYRKEYKIGEIQ